MTGQHWRRLIILTAVGAATLLTACQRPPAPGPQAGALSDVPILNNVTAAELVHDLAAAGLGVANSHDVTGQKCPDIKCVEAIDTDSVSVFRFSTTGAAEEYTGTMSGTYQAENFVLQFKPSVPVEGRGAYEKVVEQQLH
jgi:hypothetical protein